MLENKLSQEIAENVIYLNNKLEDLKERRNRAGKILESVSNPYYVVPDRDKSLVKCLRNEVIRTNAEIYNLKTFMYGLSQASISDYKKETEFDYMHSMFPKAFVDLNN